MLTRDQRSRVRQIGWIIGLCMLAVLPCRAQAAQAPPLPDPVRVSTGTSEEPRISGLLITWTDVTGFIGAGGGLRTAYCLMDPMTQVCPVQYVPETAGGQIHPDVDGQFIIWQREIGWKSNSPIFVYDTVRQQLWTLGDGILPRISGRRLVWARVVDAVTAQRDLFTCLFDPETGACPEEVVADSPDSQVLADLEQDLVVWFEPRGVSGGAVFYRDLGIPGSPIQDINSAGSPRLGPTASRAILQDGILERVLVWPTFFSDRQARDLHWCRVPGGEACFGEPLTNDEDLESGADLSGPFLVWMGSDDPKQGTVKLLDLRHADLPPIIVSTPDTDDAPLFQQDPAISGNRVVWKEGVISGNQPHRPLEIHYRVIPVQFLRGDADMDGKVNLTDAIFILQYLFQGGPVPPILDAADVNDDAKLDITDPIQLLQHLFLGGPPPAGPFPVAGLDLSPDPLN